MNRIKAFWVEKSPNVWYGNILILNDKQMKEEEEKTARLERINGEEDEDESYLCYLYNSLSSWSPFS